MVAISVILLMPYEYFVKRYYIKKAKDKLASLTHLKVIAITGSFGKTSVKNYLYNILKNHYTVVMTPKSYNTAYGITKTILNDLNCYVDY
ncbi:MAG: UDP-N-acetylmuramoyl-tripeptide--D-alanyl-D-alanine ligase, partial [Clostridia bacterium]|nr:UDP-N-acetylmuramoyl-tripeptide--D-alanyl-D-alanine ligase [Clostridia bacterium]